MKVQKASRIGIVVADDALRAAQYVDGRLVTSQVSLGKDIGKSLRQLLTSYPFVGRSVVVGLEGSAVLIESLVVPPGVSRSAKAVCADRLRGDPVFNEENAALEVACAAPANEGGPTMVILAAVHRRRITELMAVCRDQGLLVHAVEAAPLAAWRAWSGSGLQVRLLRRGGRDTVLAGLDGRLMFCRIVDGPISSPELRATLTRAASLLGRKGFDGLTVNGASTADMQQMTRELGLPVAAPEVEMEDPQAAGLAVDGAILTDFTPQEERALRSQRRARKLRLTLAACGVAIVLGAGLLGWQRISWLEARRSALEGKVRLAQEARADLSSLQAELQTRRKNEARFMSAVPGHRMSTLFGIIANSAPEDLLIETLFVDDMEDAAAKAAVLAARKAKKRGKKAEQHTGPIPRSLVVRLQGLARGADVVRDYADQLLASTAFTDVRVENSERVILDGGAEGERFKIYARAETR